MKRILAIVLDAAEPSLVEQWMEAGDLPNLKRLRERGAYGRMESVAGWLAESVAYCFYTGRDPASHGAHCYVMFQKETMTFRPPGLDWLPIRPFWRDFQAGGPRAVVLDVSNAPAPTPFHGVEISGWATQDALGPFQTHPPGLAKGIRARYGAGILPEEMYGQVRKRDFLRTRDLLLEITGKFKDLCLDLMKKEPWDLFLACLFTIHHAGHRLWSPVNVRDPLTAVEQAELNDAQRRVYAAGDRAVGDLVQAAGDDVLVMVMSMHGMGVNNSRTWIFPEMLRRVLGTAGDRAAPIGLIQKIRALIPVEWRHQIKSRLPYHLRRWLTRTWRTSGFKWDQTRAFSLFSDTQGWVRINLKGREARGIVEPAEYDGLCERISEGLKSYVDAQTGEPLVKSVLRPHQAFEGERLDDLPDLIVNWAESPAAMHREVVSPQFGAIPWPIPGHNPEGRSGNHRWHGFLMLAGDGVKPGRIENAHLLDLAPTILSLLGQPVPAEMQGRVLSILRN